jgi:hypothetical protein
MRTSSSGGRRELPFVFEYSGLCPHPTSLVDTLATEYSWPRQGAATSN